MPFRYKLQTVLGLLEKKEKQIDAEVLEVARKRDIELDKLNEMEMRKNAAQKGLAGQMAAGATDVAASNDYIQLLNQRAHLARQVGDHFVCDLARVTAHTGGVQLHGAVESTQLLFRR